MYKQTRNWASNTLYHFVKEILYLLHTLIHCALRKEGNEIRMLDNSIDSEEKTRVKKKRKGALNKEPKIKAYDSNCKG